LSFAASNALTRREGMSNRKSPEELDLTHALPAWVLVLRKLAQRALGAA
jgi:hypothetical protein